MSKRYESSEVDCPFYHSETPQKLYCEGVKDGTSIHLAFASSLMMKQYREEHCCSNYDSCIIAGMLFQKYEDGESDEQVL